MEWISVNDRLPENDKNVLAVLDGRLCVMSYYKMRTYGNPTHVWTYVYDGLDGDGEFDDDYQPTHWMPLPNPPKETE